MHTVDRKAMVAQKEALRISWVLLQKLTVEKDPEGKGVSEITLRRVLVENGETKISTFLLICDCLDLDPRNVLLPPEPEEALATDKKADLLYEAVVAVIKNSGALDSFFSKGA